MGLESLKYSLPMSAANTYTEYEKALEQEIGQKRRGKKGSSTKIMWIEDIEVEWEQWDACDIDKADQQLLQITTNSEAAAVNISDKRTSEGYLGMNSESKLISSVLA